ncbi:MAG: branched-chain amino acid transferase [Gammaproteobacteria bacterium]|nr:branched-chain amino acid transferase [Gammaproteobacteria bacterium]
MSNTFADGCAWVEGAFVPIGEARIPLTEMGFTRSDATYDVVAAWRGKFFRLDDHLQRFARGCGYLQLSPPVRFDEIPEILAQCVRRAELQDAYVEMICTRGVPRAGNRDPRRVENRFYAFAVPYVWIAPPALQAEGIALIVARGVERISQRAVDSTVKNFQWGDFVRAQYEAYDRGGWTAVLLDSSGRVTEGPGFNLFAYTRGTLLTPPTGVLHGITRQTILELAAQERIPTRQVEFDLETLQGADEIFLTSTAGGVIPVATLDGEPVGAGGPGPVTLRLHARYWQAHEYGPWVSHLYGASLGAGGESDVSE